MIHLQLYLPKNVKNIVIHWLSLSLKDSVRKTIWLFSLSFLHTCCWINQSSCDNNYFSSIINLYLRNQTVIELFIWFFHFLIIHIEIRFRFKVDFRCNFQNYIPLHLNFYLGNSHFKDRKKVISPLGWMSFETIWPKDINLNKCGLLDR